ncbi:MAG: ribokinase [Anaerolineae bacterium]
MADIVVIGSLNADLVVRSPRFPAPGETIQGEDLATIPGGKGANQAVAAARLGADVAMIGCVGADGFGTMLIENLNQNKVDARHVFRDGSAATGTAIIVVDSDGQNSIVISPGANGRIAATDIEPAALTGARLLLLQLEIPLDTVAHAARLARQQGIKVLLNPAPARELPDELLQCVDYLIPNETELAMLTGARSGERSSLEKAAHSLLRRGARNVVVTLGENGALMSTRLGRKYIPSYKVRPVDTTAAGDAFIGGLAYALLHRKPLKDAVKYGCACGALATTRFGAQPSLPTADEVKLFLRSA